MFRVEGLGLKVKGFRLEGLVFRVPGSGLMVQGLRLRI